MGLNTIDSPVANNTRSPLNKAAFQSVSLYQQCSELRTRLLRIKGFEYYFSLVSSFTDPDQPTDPVTHIWDVLSLGVSLCYLADMLSDDLGFPKINCSMLRPQTYKNPDRAKKHAIALFAMQIKDNISTAIPGCELFTVTDLWDRNSMDGLVKVVHTVMEIVKYLQKDVSEELLPTTLPLDWRNIVGEMMETERKYVQDLEVLKGYSNALYQNNIIDQDTIHLLFPNLKNLLNFQRKFLIRLEKTAELPLSEQRWGLDFLESEEGFVVYEPYCANYTNASELMLAHEQTLAALNDLINVKGELLSFLIRPLQMVCSYPLLLDSLIKSASPSTYYYYEELKLGSEAAKRVADKIGKAQHRAEKERMIKNLQSRVKEWKLPRIADFGELLLNDIILTTKSDIVRHWNLHVFLFEKIIVCFKEIVPNVPNGDSKKHGKNNSLLKKQVISAPQNASRTTTRLVLKGRIYLKHVTRVMSMSLPAKTIGGDYPLRIWWNGDNGLEFFTLYCRKKEQTHQWEAQINRLMNEISLRHVMERPELAIPNGASCRIDSTTHTQSQAFLLVTADAPPNYPVLSLQYAQSMETEREEHSHFSPVQEYSTWQHDDFDVDEELTEQERWRNMERDSNRDQNILLSPPPLSASHYPLEALSMSQTTPVLPSASESLSPLSPSVTPQIAGLLAALQTPQPSPLNLSFTSPLSSPTFLSSPHATIRTLLTKLREVRAVGASMINDNTLSLSCGLLDLHDATIVSEVKTASDAELLLDFLLHLILEGSLAPDANRKARRLIFKLISKIDVMPRSLFITDVEKDPKAVVVGGFGNVFKGKHDGQLVALKMLYKGRRAGDSIEKGFYTEALAWRSLSHRFILPLLGIYEEGSQLFLVSPFMTNGALCDWRKEHSPVRLDEIQRLLLEVAEGIRYIHSEGIVHGDLHGGNVLLDSEFHCQITDFGSTRHSEGTVTRSTTALAINFAAPELFGSCVKCGQPECGGCYEDLDGEQHRGKTIETDVYAFGCLYYAIFFDTVPFHGNNDLQVMRLVTNGVCPKRLNIPIMEDYTWNIVQRCWGSNPSGRPTMEDIVKMLIPAA